MMVQGLLIFEKIVGIVMFLSLFRCLNILYRFLDMPNHNQTQKELKEIISKLYPIQTNQDL